MKCDGVAEAFCPFWPSPNAVCSRLKQTCQIWFLGGSPNLSMIYKWRQRSFLDNNFHNLPLNCCTWFLIWWEFPNCPFFWLHCMTSPDCLDWPWYTPKPPSKKVARFFVKGPQTTFAWCHLLSLEKGHACISKHDQSPKMHPTLPRSAFCSGGHRFLGRFWDATCA